jgi:predicted dehydrogenase
VERRAWSALELGLAGVNRFGKPHTAVLGTMPAVRLGTIRDPNAGELTTVVDRYRVPARSADDERMIAEPAQDAVVLTTPEPLHAAQTPAAIERGLPVFIEKPLAMTADEGQAIAGAAEVI